MAESSSATTPLSSDKDHPDNNADDKFRHQMNDGRRLKIKIIPPRPPPPPSSPPPAAASSDEAQETTNDDVEDDDDYNDIDYYVDDDINNVDDEDNDDDDVEDVYDEKLPGYNATLKSLINRLSNFMNINDENDPKIILQRELTVSDLNPNLGRLSMPNLQLIVRPFLRYPEHLNLRDKKGFKIKVKVIMNNTMYDMLLRAWEYPQEKTEEPQRFTYMLQSGWKELVEEQNLKNGNTILVMSFRIGKKLHFAIFRE